MGRLKVAIEALRGRKADVRSSLERTTQVLSRAKKAMQDADAAIERTEHLVQGRFGPHKTR
jgi:hypothetical protein